MNSNKFIVSVHAPGTLVEFKAYRYDDADKVAREYRTQYANAYLVKIETAGKETIAWERNGQNEWSVRAAR